MPPGYCHFTIVCSSDPSRGCTGAIPPPPLLHCPQLCLRLGGIIGLERCSTGMSFPSAVHGMEDGDSDHGDTSTVHTVLFVYIPVKLRPGANGEREQAVQMGASLVCLLAQNRCPPQRLAAYRAPCLPTLETDARPRPEQPRSDVVPSDRIAPSDDLDVVFEGGSTASDSVETAGAPGPLGPLGKPLWLPLTNRSTCTLCHHMHLLSSPPPLHPHSRQFICPEPHYSRRHAEVQL